MVPTWNYATVHAHGVLEIAADAVEAQGVMAALVQRFEAARATPWTFKREERERDALIGAIVPFRMRIRRIDAKFKLSQNRTSLDRARVIAALRAETFPEARETAEWMQRYGGHDDEPR
jgi:transcriptional regulator